MAEKAKDRRSLTRKLIQLYAALLYNANIRGYIEGNIYTGTGKMFCVPGLNCYSCPGAIAACPLGALQNALSSTGHRAPFYVLGILLLFGVILGRTVCGWLCPVGLVQELLYKIPSPKLKKNRVTRILSYLKYAILAVFVIIIPLVYAFKDAPLPAFCKYICPAGTISGALEIIFDSSGTDMTSMIGSLFINKWVILVLIVAASVFIYRTFCRFICPLGAIYGLFNRLALVGIRVNDDKCTRCGKCISNCPMDVKKVCDHECINCGKCIGTCPQNAISLRAGKKVLFGETDESDRMAGLKPAGKKGRRAAVIVMAVIFAGVFLFANMPEGSMDNNRKNSADTSITADGQKPASGTDEQDSASGIAAGHEAGQILKDFTLTTTDGDVFKLSDYRGKTVFINLWATWCAPCVKELPYFERLKEEHPEDVEIIAIHSNMITDDVKEYLSNYDYTIDFAIDETGDVISMLGGSALLPQTIVVSPDGIVTYNSAGSITYELLEELMGKKGNSSPSCLSEYIYLFDIGRNG